MKPTYRHLKEMLESLSEDQLNDTVTVRVHGELYGCDYFLEEDDSLDEGEHLIIEVE